MAAQYAQKLPLSSQRQGLPMANLWLKALSGSRARAAVQSWGLYSEATLMLLVQDREAYERKFAYFLQSAAFLVVVALLYRSGAQPQEQLQEQLYWG